MPQPFEKIGGPERIRTFDLCLRRGCLSQESLVTMPLASFDRIGSSEPDLPRAVC